MTREAGNLKNIGQQYGVSAETIRQVELRVLKAQARSGASRNAVQLTSFPAAALLRLTPEACCPYLHRCMDSKKQPRRSSPAKTAIKDQTSRKSFCP